MDALQVQGLVLSLYDAAVGDGTWNQSLTLFASILSSTVVVLFSQADQSTFFGNVGIEPPYVKQYVDYFAERNVLMTEGRALHREGIVRTTETICRPHVLLHSEYYNDFMRPLDIRYSVALTAVRDGNHAIHLSAFREHRRAPFDGADVRLLAELHPHVRRALQLHLHLADTAQRHATVEATLTSTTKGIAFLNAERRVVYMNAALREMLASRDGLLLTRNEISATHVAAAKALRAAIAQASNGTPADALDIPRPSHRPAYSALVSPVLRRLAFIGAAHAATLLVITDPARATVPDVEILRRRYGLTPMEARIASCFMSGVDTREMAEQLGLSIHTARTHLKRILAKTNTSRQTDLMRRLLTDLR